jgi:hypothetical protein
MTNISKSHRFILIQAIVFISITMFSTLSQADWFGKEISTSDDYYFYGSGALIGQARLMALSDLTQQLSSSVKSTLSYDIEKQQGRIVKDTALYSASLSSAEISLPPVTWFESDQNEGLYRVGGVLKKSVLITWLQQDFEQVEARIKLLSSDVSNLNHYIFVKKQSEIVQRAFNTAKILANLCLTACNANKFNEWLTKYKQHLAVPQHSCIVVTEETSEDLSHYLADMLVENGFIQSSFNQQGCYQLNGKVKKTYARKGNSKNVDALLTLSLKSGNQVIASNRIKFSGHSENNYQQAWSAALSELFETQVNAIALLIK